MKRKLKKIKLGDSEYIFAFCRDCRCTRWLHYRELPDFVNEHSGHIIGVSPKDLREDLKGLQEWFRKFIG